MVAENLNFRFTGRLGLLVDITRNLLFLSPGAAQVLLMSDLIFNKQKRGKNGHPVIHPLTIS